MLNKKLVEKYYPYLVAGCLIVKNNKILLVKEGIIERGKWNQPAGWLDKYERPIDCAKREAQEETGLKVKITHLLGCYNLIKLGQKDIKGLKKHNTHSLKLIFLAKIIKGKIEIDHKEIIDAKFFTPKEIFKMSDRELRDLDIKDEIRNYLNGKIYPLVVIRHTRYRVKY